MIGIYPGQSGPRARKGSKGHGDKSVLSLTAQGWIRPQSSAELYQQAAHAQPTAQLHPPCQPPRPFRRLAVRMRPVARALLRERGGEVLRSRSAEARRAGLRMEVTAFGATVGAAREVAEE